MGELFPIALIIPKIQLRLCIYLFISELVCRVVNYALYALPELEQSMGGFFIINFVWCTILGEICWI